MTRFLIAVIRNFGAAIAISLFFAAARGPALHHASVAANAVTGASAIVYEHSVQPPNSSSCDHYPGRVCRMTKASQ